MTLQTTFNDNWLEKVLDLNNAHFTGQFYIKSQQTFCHFQMSFGWIFYATRGSTQTLRRRLLLYCPQIKQEQLPIQFLSSDAENFNSWEYPFLFGLVESKDISKEKAEQIISLSILETLYEVLYDVNQIDESDESSLNSSDPPLILLNPEKLLAEIQGLSQIWQGAKIPGSPFKLAPVFKQPEQVLWQQQSSAKLYSEYLDGKHTLWDVATKVQHSAIEVAQELIPNILTGAIELLEVSDFPLSLTESSDILTEHLFPSTVGMRGTGEMSRSIVTLPPQAAPIPSEALVLREDFPAIDMHGRGVTTNPDIWVIGRNLGERAEPCFKLSVGVSVKCGVEGSALSPRQHSAPSSTLVSRLPKVDWLKGLTQMSEFFVGATRVFTTGSDWILRVVEGACSCTKLEVCPQRTNKLKTEVSSPALRIASILLAPRRNRMIAF